MSEKREKLYQFLNTGKFTFQGEWLYNGQSLEDFQTKFIRDIVAIDPEFKGLVADAIMFDSAKECRFHNAPYVEQVFHSTMNLWLHYSLGQYYVALEKTFKPDPAFLSTLSTKESKKYLRDIDSQFQNAYSQYEKGFL